MYRKNGSSSITSLNGRKPGGSSPPAKNQDNTNEALASETTNYNYNSQNRSMVFMTLRNFTNSKPWYTISVLCFANLINYMDRFTIAGVLTDVQDEFDVGDARIGLLQTVFILLYMTFAPLFGYLGDRYSRRILMIVGVFIWSSTTLLNSFMYNFYWFMALRALVGIGQASFTTIAPTIISDLFVNNMRSKALALFFLAIPIGGGLGYIVGSGIATAAKTWRAALRATPGLGAIAITLLYFIEEPQRGHSEGSVTQKSKSSIKDDLKYLIKNRSFILITFGFACVSFVVGALSWFGPKYIFTGLLAQSKKENIKINIVSFIFGALAIIAGIIGISLGAILSLTLKKHFSRTDPLLCAFGLLISVPLVVSALILVEKSEIATYILIFFGMLFININWAIVSDMTLYVIEPGRRSIAVAVQILISRGLGDAGSPYLVGIISDILKKYFRNSQLKFLKDNLVPESLKHLSVVIEQTNLTRSTKSVTPAIFKMKSSHHDEVKNEFKALQYALLTTSFVQILGGIIFIITAFYIVQDKLRATEERKENEDISNLNNSSTKNL